MPKLFIESRYGIAPDDLLNDPELSLKAKGLFTFMQSKPDGWKFSIHRIEGQNKDGEDSIASGLKELEKAGWIERKPAKNKGGQWDGYDYYLYSKPKSPCRDFPVTEKPVTEKPFTENHPTLSNTDSSKTDNSKKEKELPAKAGARSQVKMDPNTPMNLQEFVIWVKASPQAHMRLIGDYAEEKGTALKTKGQWEGFISRNLRDATTLIKHGFDADQISEAVTKIKKNFTGQMENEWTLQTVYKYLTK